MQVRRSCSKILFCVPRTDGLSRVCSQERTGSYNTVSLSRTHNRQACVDNSQCLVAAYYSGSNNCFVKHTFAELPKLTGGTSVYATCPGKSFD